MVQCFDNSQFTIHNSQLTNDQSSMSKTLVLLLGPTGVGKTELSLRVAEHYGCPIVSCDSRQIFRGIPIGTAAPTADVEELFKTHDIVVMTGGSMLYADAVCKGLDDLPAVPAEIREEVKRNYEQGGLAWLQSEVQRLDPDYWKIVDQQNPARLMHCVELSRTAGKPYSSLLSNSQCTIHNSQFTMHNAQLGLRPFRIVKVALERDREELYDRINRRVEQMIADGLEQEAKAVYPKRHLTSLQTVGYREMFAYFDGEYDLDRAIELIQQNSRHYAKRQLTWFRRDKEIHWLNANNAYEKNIHIIDDLLGSCGLQKED